MPSSFPVTDVTICAGALTLCGLPPITDLGDVGDSEVMCNLHYPLLKGSVLTEYNWDFGIKHAQLAIDADAVPLTQYTNAFQLPSDRLYDDPILVLIDAAENAPPFKDYEIQDEHLLTNQDVIYIWYVSQDAEDESKWPMDFINFMMHALAARLSAALTERGDLTTLYHSMAWGDGDMQFPQGMYAKVRSRNFQDKPPAVFQAYELWLARFS